MTNTIGKFPACLRLLLLFSGFMICTAAISLSQSISGLSKDGKNRDVVTHSQIEHPDSGRRMIPAMLSGNLIKGPGRWLSPDPKMSEFPGWSPYNYVNGNPVILVDPNGMEADCPFCPFFDFFKQSMHNIAAAQNGNNSSAAVVRLENETSDWWKENVGANIEASLTVGPQFSAAFGAISRKFGINLDFGSIGIISFKNGNFDSDLLDFLNDDEFTVSQEVSIGAGFFEVFGKSDLQYGIELEAPVKHNRRPMPESYNLPGNRDEVNTKFGINVGIPFVSVGLFDESRTIDETVVGKDRKRYYEDPPPGLTAKFFGYGNELAKRMSRNLFDVDFSAIIGLKIGIQTPNALEK